MVHSRALLSTRIILYPFLFQSSLVLDTILWTAAGGVSLIAGGSGSCSLSWVVLTTLVAGTVSSSLTLVEGGIESDSGEVRVVWLMSMYAVSRCMLL